MSDEIEQEQFPTVIARKHKIKRFHRKVAGQWFWVAEVWPPLALNPAVSIMLREDQGGTLEEATKKAEAQVQAMIKNGGRVSMDGMNVDAVFDTRGGTLDALNPKTASGKRQWCEKHWKLVEDGMINRTHNGIVAGLLLTSEFVETIKRDRVVQLKEVDSYAMEMLRDSYSPFCCWLGDEKVNEILASSTNEAIEQSGILRDLEKQLRRSR